MKDKIFNYIESLSDREKAVFVLLGFTLSIFIAVMMYFVMQGAVDDKLGDIEERKGLLSRFETYERDYRSAKEREEKMVERIRRNKININSYISGIRESLSIDISTTKELKAEKKGSILVERVELSLRRVELPTLLSFLYSLENRNRNVFIDELTLKKRHDRRNYDSTVVVATLKEVEEE